MLKKQAFGCRYQRIRYDMPWLDHGADLPVIQLLLGHSDASTMQLCTYIARGRLQALHVRQQSRG